MAASKLGQPTPGSQQCCHEAKDIHYLTHYRESLLTHLEDGGEPGQKAPRDHYVACSTRKRKILSYLGHCISGPFCQGSLTCISKINHKALLCPKGLERESALAPFSSLIYEGRKPESAWRASLQVARWLGALPPCDHLVGRPRKLKSHEPRLCLWWPTKFMPVKVYSQASWSMKTNTCLVVEQFCYLQAKALLTDSGTHVVYWVTGIYMILHGAVAKIKVMDVRAKRAA